MFWIIVFCFFIEDNTFRNAYTVLYKVFIFIKSALLSKLFGQLYLIFSDNNNLFSDNDASFAAFFIIILRLRFQIIMNPFAAFVLYINF